jgi:hypothetical protein
VGIAAASVFSTLYSRIGRHLGLGHPDKCLVAHHTGCRLKVWIGIHHASVGWMHMIDRFVPTRFLWFVFLRHGRLPGNSVAFEGIDYSSLCNRCTRQKFLTLAPAQLAFNNYLSTPGGRLVS